MLLSRGRSRRRPKGLSRAGLVTSRAAERGPFPLGSPPAPRAAVRGRAGRTQRWPLPPLPALPLGCPQARARPPRPPGSPTPSPRDSSGSQRHSTPAEGQAPGSAAAVLTILSLGSAQSPPPPPPPSSSGSSATRPPRSQPMKNEVRRRLLDGGPHRPFYAVKRNSSLGKRRGRGGVKSRSFEKRGQHPGTRGRQAEARLATRLVRAPAMLKCGMGGSQVKGGRPCLPSCVENESLRFMGPTLPWQSGFPFAFVHGG